MQTRRWTERHGDIAGLEPRFGPVRSGGLDFIFAAYHLPVAPSPHRPFSRARSPRSPIGPDRFAFCRECVDALVRILRLHQLVQVYVLDF